MTIEVFKLVRNTPHKIVYTSLQISPFMLIYKLDRKITPLENSAIFAYESLVSAKRNKGPNQSILICEAELHPLNNQLHIIPYVDCFTTECMLCAFWQNPKNWYMSQPHTIPKWPMPLHTVLCSWVIPNAVWE